MQLRAPTGCTSARAVRLPLRMPLPAARSLPRRHVAPQALLGGSTRRLHTSSTGSRAAGRGPGCGRPSAAGPTRAGAARGSRPAGPHIAAAAYVGRGRVVICATLAGVESAAEPASLLDARVRGNDQLLTGQLPNGLRYVLLRNATPPARFEAHLEVHAGSVDERSHEQGVAHLVEHVTFLGSKRRESLLGTGARANAYTDFHHTVFHVHAPLTNCITGTPMLPQVLEALAEIAFEPQFLPLRIEKERKAVLAEAQMMNTIEYRIDCQLLAYLHAENNLGCRFPIGKTEQVKAWRHETVEAFWRTWYFPANVTLYIVGDLDRSTEEVERLIEASFGKFPAGSLADHGLDLATALPGAAGGGASNGHAAGGNGSNGSSGSSSGAALAAAAPDAPAVPVKLVPEPPAGRWAEAVLVNGDAGSVLGEGVVAVGPDGTKLRHPVRPPVVHRYGCGPLAPDEPPAPVTIFRHPLLQQFMLTLFCKLPVVSLKGMADLKYSFMVRLILSAFQFRVNQRYVAASPPFIGIDLDISDSGREGCAVSTLTITAQPVHWRDTVRVAVEESRRLQRFGLTPSELERYTLAMMRDSAQLAEQANSIPSINSLDFVMESLALGHTVMNHGDAHEAMQAVADTITLPEVNAAAASLLAFASDVGGEAALLEAAAAPEAAGQWARPGPTRATSLVACIPAYIAADGNAVRVAGAAGVDHNRGALGASGHLDADSINLEELEAQGRQVEELAEMEAPEGAIAFDVSPADILAALAAPDLDIQPPPDVELPDHLVAPAAIEARVAELAPRFIPLTGDLAALAAADPASLSPEACRPPTNADTGILQRRLSNGIRVNYRHTDNEPKAGLLRIVAPGGRASEARAPGPAGVGAVGVGTRALSEGGAVGEWSREQVEAFCIANLVNSVMDSNDEFLVLDVHCAATNGGLRCAFELLHQLLQAPNWDEAAFERSKLAFVNSGASVGKSLERASSARIMAAMLGDDMRFRDPPAEQLEELTLEGVREVLERQLHPSNLELNVAGDFDTDELERLVLHYLGTVTSRHPAPERAALMGEPVQFQNPEASERHITWHLRDSDERAAAYIAGPAPCRWGPFGSRAPLAQLPGPPAPPPPPATNPAAAAAATAARRAHPLYTTVSLQLLAEVVNSRLFTTVRDSLGLTYDVSFEVTTFDRLRAGWFTVLVTSYPDKIHEALAASLAVLREIAVSPITPRELMRAKRTLLTRHESDLKDNNYWLGLLTHLQSPDVPHKRVQCLRDLRAMYEGASVDDLYDAYTHFDFSDGAVFTCVGSSGRAPPPAPDKAALEAAFGGVGGAGAAAAAGARAALGQVDWSAAFSKAFGATFMASQAAAQPQPQPQQPQQQQQQHGSDDAPGAQPQPLEQPGQAPGKLPGDPMAMLSALLAASKVAQVLRKPQAEPAAGEQQQQQQQQQQQPGPGQQRQPGGHE